MIWLLILFPFLFEVSAASYNREIRLCKCDEQKECFVSMTKQCLECFGASSENTKNQLKKIYGLKPETLTPCFDQFDEFIKRFLGCVNEDLAKEKSCGNINNHQTVPLNNFPGIFMKQKGTLEVKRMKHLYGLDKSPKWLLKWHDEAKECTFAKVPTNGCFTKKECGLKATSDQVGHAIKKCYDKLNVVDVHYEMCDCLHKKGVKDQLEDYCENVKKAKLVEISL